MFPPSEYPVRVPLRANYSSPARPCLIFGLYKLALLKQRMSFHKGSQDDLFVISDPPSLWSGEERSKMWSLAKPEHPLEFLISP